MNVKVDFFVGIFLLVFSVGIFYMTGQMPQKEDGLGPGDYPRVIAYCVALLGFIQTVLSVRRMRRADQPTSSPRIFEKREILNIFFLTVCVAVYLVALPYLGFIILTPFLMFMMMLLFGLRKWIKMIVVSVVSTAVVYFLFDKFFLVLLPRFSLF